MLKNKRVLIEREKVEKCFLLETWTSGVFGANEWPRVMDILLMNLKINFLFHY